MRAFSWGSITQPLNSASNAPTSITSKAADEDRPLPLNTVLVTQASKPPMRYFSCARRAATPRISANVVSVSSPWTLRSTRSTSKAVGKPSEYSTTRLSPRGATAATVSRFTAAASTLPFWWSVWLPTTSARPGAETKASGSRLKWPRNASARAL